MRTLQRYRQGAADQSPVLPGASKMNLAARLREHLLEAGVTRAELLDSNGRRRAFPAHDLRAFFVTSALVAGRSEAWVMARTGHDSSQMLNKYRRNTAHWTELGLSTIAPLDEAIPDLPAAPPPRGPGRTSSGSPEGEPRTQFEESANASAEVSAPASARAATDARFPRDFAQFRRRDSNPNSRNQKQPDVADVSGVSVGEATVEAGSVPAGPGSDGRLAAAVVAVPILSEALVSAIVAGDRRRAKALVAAIELVAVGRSADDPGGDSSR